MKLNKKILKQLINEVVEEDSKSMILEDPQKSKYDKVMSILREAPYGSVAIMSGQFPMGQAPDPSAPDIAARANQTRKAELETKINEMGLKFLRIGGKFGPNIEQSVLVYDPKQNRRVSLREQMDFLEKVEILCRQFRQWGFVGGHKITVDTSQGAMSSYEFVMYMIDYDQEMGFMKDPASKPTNVVVGHDELASADNYYSFDPTSGKKFGMELYEYMTRDQNVIEVDAPNSVIEAMRKAAKYPGKKIKFVRRKNG
jgi:hypothetical protein